MAPLYFFPSIFSSLGSLSAAGLFVVMFTFLLLLMKEVWRRVDVISPHCCVQIHELNSLAVFRVTGSPSARCDGTSDVLLVFFRTVTIALEELGRLTPALISSQLWHFTSRAGSTFLLPDFLPEDLKMGPRPRMRKHPVRPLEERNLQRGQTAQSPKPYWASTHHTEPAWWFKLAQT